jgi:hypothetical protein
VPERLAAMDVLIDPKRQNSVVNPKSPDLILKIVGKIVKEASSSGRKSSYPILHCERIDLGLSALLCHLKQITRIFQGFQPSEAIKKGSPRTLAYGMR